MKPGRTSLGKGAMLAFGASAARVASSSTLIRSSKLGFTLLEMTIVVAITGILMALSAWGFFSLKTKISQRNFVAEINSALSSGKMRAISRQSNVIFVFDTAAGAYYQLDDISAAQNLNTQANLATVRTTFSPTAPNYGLAPMFSVRLVATGTSPGTVFIANAASWGRDTMSMPVPFPYPYSGINVDTSSGCTFCATGRGVLAFRPDGKVVFGTAAGVPVGGALVLGQGQSSSQQNLRAIFVSLSGHVGSATQ